MGTRHEIKVIVDGEVKVKQYGQWDGYPSGQGATIAKFLQETIISKPRNLAKFKNKARRIHFCDQKEIDEINSYDWKRISPYLSRDTGADILNWIWDGGITRLIENDKEGEKWCEYFYIIDLDKETVQINNRKKWKFEEFTIERVSRLK